MLSDGAPYNGGRNNRNTGDERVVYHYKPGDVDNEGHPKGAYCGIMTHHGQDTGQFALCK